MVKINKLNGVKACVFDAYGTLLDVAAVAESCRDALGEKVAPLAELWRQKQLEYTWLRSLMDDFQDFWHVTGHALDYAMERLKLNDLPLRARLMELYFKIKAHPDSKPCLEKLRAADMKTAILSNANVSMLFSAINHAGLQGFLDTILSVDKLRTYKPHASVYQMAVDYFNIEPHEICFLSSNAWDVAGASKFGFQVIWINRGNGQLDRLGHEPKLIISSLNDLPQLVLP